MKKRFPFLFLLPAIALFPISSCNDQAANDNNTTNTDSAPIDLNKDVVTAENVFVYIPSPIETANLLKDAGAKYDKDLLNPPENIPHYSTTASEALNLGVYGADLAFAGIFDQHAEVMIYMNATGKMAEALHVSSAFDESRHERLENNMNNRDSVLSIITDSYWDCDAMLHDNHQQYASALMVAGGWVEGLYLACKVAEKTSSNEIRVRIAEQHYSLDKLVSLLDKQDNADVKPVAAQLHELKKIFDALPKPSDQSPVVTTDTTNGVTTVGDDSSPPPASLNALEFNQILDKVSSIRSSIVNGN